MSFTLHTWWIIFSLICTFMFILSMTLTSKRPYKEYIHHALCFLAEFIIWLGILVTGSIYMEGAYIEKGDVSTLAVGEYIKKGVYRDLNEVNTCVSNEYNGKLDKLHYNDYYYDYMKIVLTDKPISFTELISYMKKQDFNIIYNSESKLHKVTKSLSLEGILKVEIKEGIVQYSIDNYILCNNKENSISALVNNPKVKLDIVYNEDVYKNDKIISEYVIINAKTIQ